MAKSSFGYGKEMAIMPALRLVRADEPFEVHENVDLRRTLERLTKGTNDWRNGIFVLLPHESAALYEVLAHRVFSQVQLEEIERFIRKIDPRERDSKWNSRRLRSFVRTRRRALDRPEWIDLYIRRLHAAMRSQGPGRLFHLWLCRASLVAFLTSDPQLRRSA